MIGWWTEFPFWISFWICAIGGTLGVMYSIPLRRALVTQSTLPYPEGVAAAEVLKVGSSGPAEGAAAAEGHAGLVTMVVGSLASAGFAALVGMKLFAAEIAGYWRFGRATSGMGAGFSLAIMGAGHLMGIAVGIALLVGLVITWGIAVPILTALNPAGGSAVDFATDVWQHKARFIGAGAIGAAAVWTLGRLALPTWRGLASAMAAS